MSFRCRPLGLLSLFALSCAPLHAQSPWPRWQVVAGTHDQVAVAGLPAGVSRNLRGALLADRGATSVGFYIANPASERGYWVLRDGRFERYARPASEGNDGPGRAGGEAAHQFLEFPEFSGDAGPDGQRLIRARAGDPSQPAGASYGLWRWNGSLNIEIVRAGSDGALGPGLGAGWRFDNAADLGWGRMLGNGSALIHGGVRDGAGIPARVVSRHLPGVGNQACLRSGPAEPPLRPGLAADDQFFSFSDSTLERFASSPDGRVYAHLPISSFGGSALFEICDGPPRAIAVVDVIGALGPDVGLLEARFVSLSPPRLGADGALFFRATWRVPNSHQPGLFHHDGLGNRGIAYNEPTGFFGPNWENASWHSISGDSLSVAGDWLAFGAELANAGVGNPRGIWRQRRGQRPELLALLHASASAGEAEPGRRWREFNDFAVLANGDVVLRASTNPGPRTDLWLLSPERAPRRLLSPGDQVEVPTANGSVPTTITGFMLAASGPGLGDGRNPENGIDGWVAADGGLLLRAFTAQHGDLLLATRIDIHRLFGDSFEGF